MSLQYRETIDYIYGLKRLGIRPGLDAVKGLLRILGSPERSVLAVHVAGTNGKGSTSAMIASVLREAGYRVGLYTSPHLLKFNERIRVSGVDISDEALMRNAKAVLEASRRLKAESGLEATFFEAATAMALLYFKEQKVDMAVMETGMGGRLDATNVVPPLVSVITGVALDHGEYLGNSIKEVAVEKAGIIKKGVPVISGALDTAAARVIEERALEVTGLRPVSLGHEFRYEEVERGRLDYSGLNLSLKGVETGLRGAHQRENAAIALAALESLQAPYPAINEAAMREGLRCVDWPGRFEVISSDPCVVLDCAHNPEGARALAAALREYFPPPATMTLVAGISRDKDISGILSHLAPLARRVILTEANLSRAAPLSLLARTARRFKKGCEQEPSVERAIGRALKDLPVDEVIVIAGSIFVVGEARDFFIKARKVPAIEGARGEAATG